VAGVSFDELPEDLRKAAAEAVTAGSGYFQIAHGPALRHTLPAFLAADAQQLGSPDFGSPSRDRWLTDFDRRLDALRTYRTPAGRVVTLVWPADLWGNGGLLPRARADALNAPPSVEDYYAIIGEALRWAK